MLKIRSQVNDLKLAATGAILLTTLAIPASTAAAAPDCSRENGPPPEEGPALAEAVALTPAKGSESRLVNFDTNRDAKRVKNIVLQSDKRLPASLTARQLGVDTQLQRAGDTLESTDFPDPTYTEPVIRSARRRISFSVCLDPDKDTDAGKYVGAVTLTGPEGLSDASVSLTANTKNGTGFLVGSLLAILIAFVLVLAKRRYGEKKGLSGKWLIATLFTLGAAWGGLYATYANDPAWGANGVGSILALIGLTFAAIGGQSIVTSFQSD